MTDHLFSFGESPRELGGQTGANESNHCSLPYRRNAPSTSKRAARTAARTAPIARVRIEAFIREQGRHGATACEAAAALGMVVQTVGPRMLDLRRTGAIVDAGIERPTPTGCASRVYVAAEFAPCEGGAK